MSKVFKERFGLDPVVLEAYPKLSRQDVGGTWEVFRPQYDLANPERRALSYQMLLDCDHKASLWVDLSRYEAEVGRASVQWCSAGKHALFLGARVTDVELNNKALQAQREFSGLNLNNFFSRSTCDIEADIYRLGFDALDLLFRAIHRREKGAIFEHPSQDLHTIFRRFLVVNHQPAGEKSERVKELFKEYVELRYGGKMQLVRELPSSELAASSERLPDSRRLYSTSLDQLLGELSEARNTRKDAADLALLDALERFYRESEVWRALKAN